MKGTAHYWLAGALAGMTLLWLALFGEALFTPSPPAADAPAPAESPASGHLGQAPQPPATTPPAPEQAATPRSGGILLVMDDLGESREAAQSLLRLPVPVVFAIWPHARHARETAEAAHAAGREVFIHLPMQPQGYPRVQPGPGAVTLHTDLDGVRRIVRDARQRVPHAAGINNHMGSRLTIDAAAMEKLCIALADTGLVILDSVTHPGSLLYSAARAKGLPAMRRQIFLDHQGGKAQALRQLEKAQALARAGGMVVVIGHPHPETLSALAQWAAQRENAALALTVRQMGERGAL